MTFTIKTLAAAAISFAVAAPVFAGQVAAGPGITLTEAAQAKFNRDTGRDGRQEIVVGGPSASANGSALNAFIVAKINREAGRDEQQLVKSGQVTMSSRSPAMADDQLVAAAGLTPEQAAGLSLSEIAAAKFGRDTDQDN